jgi:hypothetical protein
MIGLTLVAAALLGGGESQPPRPPVHVDTPLTLLRPEARIRNMSEYLEAVVDRHQGVFIRGYTGQWYYARTEHGCARLTRGARLGFIPSPGGDFDRDSVIRADGQRCLVGSVVESEGPPRRTARR